MLILCIQIFLVRILDVSLGTIRTILTIKGKNVQASLVGFFEVLVWFIIVKEALNTDESSLWIAISYAGGFATGTYIGGIISDHFITGNLAVQVVTSSKNDEIIKMIRSHGYGVSVIDAKGTDKKDGKYMLFIEINKKRLSHLKNLIKTLDERAFVVVNETKLVENAYFK